MSSLLSKNFFASALGSTKKDDSRLASILESGLFNLLDLVYVISVITRGTTSNVSKIFPVRSL